jgi:hypothetical protein
MSILSRKTVPRGLYRISLFMEQRTSCCALSLCLYCKPRLTIPAAAIELLNLYLSIPIAI